MNTLPAKNFSISIRRPVEDVYKYASNAKNLTHWASGLAGATLEKTSEGWITDSPMGKVTIQFAKENSYGVMDHDVKTSSGQVFHNPFRVVKNNEGSEVIFTLFRFPEVTEEAFQQDSQMIESDLKRLKENLEKL